ncbi:MAG: hypothetical protein IJ150_13655 [Bacteroidales bacterium]|nr:hypothetical protein [Bacteroidales bacterium]
MELLFRPFHFLRSSHYPVRRNEQRIPTQYIIKAYKFYYVYRYNIPTGIYRCHVFDEPLKVAKFQEVKNIA